MAMYGDVIEALSPLIQAFDQLGIFYYIGGSVSSSVHGMPRRTQDVDVIADIQPNQVRMLVQRLQADYYLDAQALKDAVRRGFPYNVIHLSTMLKVDLIPLKRRAFTREEAHRARPEILEDGTPPVRIASAEDAILTKLEWFHMGGQTSRRQWDDILGIMRRQGAALDIAYLRQWADTLGVRDLLERALLDSGLGQA
ncbi:hypothetical protein KSC_040000 [Ktedonobacter sp. SOSP1-52]|uniref:hypothetical protein n=1 Tax=Ktedonobacter sp. SOSP1-52 TaxID=2778366 RepID=UPI001915983B|nr:hypothetical protein [Ktedonobacter sp. SOSP1-52]GHO65108.1 hypothetical protein KSC_040000 [Ktedonobacter sp. SOSP1-52]